MSTQPNATDRREPITDELRRASRPTVVESKTVAESIHQADAAVQRVIDSCKQAIRDAESTIHNMEAVLKRLGTR